MERALLRRHLIVFLRVEGLDSVVDFIRANTFSPQSHHYFHASPPAVKELVAGIGFGETAVAEEFSFFQRLKYLSCIG